MNSRRATYIFDPVGGGINQKVKSILLKRTEAKMLYNITHDRVGVWRSRKGNSRLATVSGSGKVQGIFAYRHQNGTEDLFLVAGGNLYKYDGTSTLSLIESDIFTITAKIVGVNYLNRLYLFSDQPGDSVRYTEGDTTTILTDVQAKYSASAQDSLWVAGRFGGEDRVYVSRYDESNNTPTDNLFDADETWGSSTRYFVLDGEVTGLMSFKDFLFAFTDHSIWSLDVRSVGTLRGGTKVQSVGTTSHHSLAVDSKLGVCLFADGNNGIYFWTGAGDPINVSDFLIEKVEESGIIDLINPNNYEILSAGIWDGKYYLSVGDLEDATKDYHEKACIVYAIAENKLSLQEIDASCFTLWKDSSKNRNLYFGSNDDRTVYKISDGIVDQDSSGSDVDVTSYVHTKDMRGEFGASTSDKTFHSIKVLYTGTAEIDVGYSMDGDDIYTKLGTLPIADDTKLISEALLMLEKRGKSISLEFKKTSGTMEIVGYELDVTTHGVSNLRPV